jgi:hypothetical protein
MNMTDLTHRIESAQIDVFVEKLRPRVAIKTGVEWAELPEPSWDQDPAFKKRLAFYVGAIAAMSLVLIQTLIGG